MADRLNSVRLISMICSVVFCIGNVMYANIALVPNNVGSLTDARVWYMLVVRDRFYATPFRPKSFLTSFYPSTTVKI
jgi:hypothetical protein